MNTPPTQDAQLLSESQDKYRTLFESIDAGFCIIEMLFDEQGHPQDYRFLEANPAFERHTGLSDACGKTARELVPDLDPFWFQTYGNVALTGEEARFENHAPAMGRWFDVYAFRVGAPQECRVGILFTDITARKKAEQELERSAEALARSEARFRVQADAMPQMVWATDAQGNHLYYNCRWYEYTGQTVEESLGFGFALALHPEDTERTLEQWQRAWKHGEDYEIEYRFRRHDGTYRWFVGRAEPVRDPETGEVTMWAGTCTDIDDLKRVQEEARERSQEIVTIFESMTDAFFALDGEWRFTYFNGEAERLLLHKREELLGRSLWEEFPAAVGSVFEIQYRRAMQERVTCTFEAYYPPPLDAWYDVRAYPSRAGLSVYFQNITERRKYEQRQAAERDALLLRQRQFMRDMVFSLTEGKFRLCLSEDDLPAPIPSATEVVPLTVPTLRLLRRKLNAIAGALHFPEERAHDIETAVGEAAMNAATHGGGGEGWVCADTERCSVQVWIKDNGGGISEEALPRVLEKGVSGAGTLGHGFWMILRACDRVYLLTGPEGTTLVLEQECVEPQPAWLQAATAMG